jgi:putative cardiolipin synthase
MASEMLNVPYMPGIREVPDAAISLRSRAVASRSTARLLGCALLLAVAGCASLPPLGERSVSTALVAPRGTPIADVVGPRAAARPGLSAIYPLRAGVEAFAARVALIDAAATSLDIQYYIWHDDLTGQLMFDAVRRAAGRGVDPTLAALDAHPNVEVRLFNPFPNRGARAWGYLTDFSRLNRRMHNKSLTADGTVTIVGGRNVGDEYFGAGDEVGFVDLDVMAGGAVVADVAKSFDAYWASESAYPAARLLSPATAADRARLEGIGAALAGDPAAERYLAAVRGTTLIRDLIDGRLPIEWVKTTVVVDEPTKALGRAAGHETLPARLARVLGGAPQSDFSIVSPYFVPRRSGVEMLTGFAARGVRVRVLTNSLEATDVAAVHSGYAKHRKPLLRGRVELFEARRRVDAPETAVGPDGGVPSASAAPEPRAAQGRGGSILAGSGSGGSSDSSLHAKTFSIDRQRIFIGSFNFDPRSVELNTEIGFVIESPSLASQLSDAFERGIPRAAYRVVLDDAGHLEWIASNADGSQLRYRRDPGASFGRRFTAGFLSLLPIDGLL